MGPGDKRIPVGLGRLAAAPPSSGVDHIDVAQLAAAAAVAHTKAASIRLTEQLRSKPRKAHIRETAGILGVSLDVTGSTYGDLAAAVDCSESRVGQWVRAEASVPSDVVLVMSERLPEVVVEILCEVAKRLPRAVFDALVDRLVALRQQRREGASCRRF
ncbi:hypothetical protein [Sorangium sp. So ce388]|uniref:hypothetical protein n=1 Tax=Sorangium sp. So ce388 TaxID=3133309 RepID=UPI003F5AE32A